MASFSFCWAAARLALAVSRATWAWEGSMVASPWLILTLSPAFTFTALRTPPVAKFRSREVAGWTVTWKGRGWDRSFDDYLALVRAGWDLTRDGRLLTVPSVKYHLPRLDEPFRDAEYAFTTRALAKAWGESPLLLEKDFSPTLAGDALSDEKAQILRWLREVPERIRTSLEGVRLERGSKFGRRPGERRSHLDSGVIDGR